MVMVSGGWRWIFNKRPLYKKILMDYPKRLNETGGTGVCIALKVAVSA